MVPVGAEYPFVDAVMDGVLGADNDAHEFPTRFLFYHSDLDGKF